LVTISQFLDPETMGRSPLRFKQTDVTRAVRAVVAAGVEVREVMVDANGAIRVITGKVEAPPAGNPALEKWLADED
jgi:hypothetical protein